MTKEEMMKDFLARFPKIISENLVLLDATLPRRLDDKEQTFKEVIDEARKLEYDINKGVLVATLDDWMCCIKPTSNGIVSIGGTVEEFEDSNWIECSRKEIAVTDEETIMKESFITAEVAKKDDTYSLDLVADGTETVYSLYGSVIEKRYLNSMKTEGKNLSSEELNSALAEHMPMEVLRTLSGSELEQMHTNAKVNVR